MLHRPSRLHPSSITSIHTVHNNYFIRRPVQIATWIFLFSLIPYVSVRTYNRIERTGYWERRIEKKRVKKMAFDYMLKSQAEKERDLIEEFADFWINAYYFAWTDIERLELKRWNFVCS